MRVLSVQVGMPSVRSVSLLFVLAGLVFLALVGDGAALCALGSRAQVSLQIVMGSGILVLTGVLGGLILILDGRTGPEEDDDEQDDGRGGGGWDPPGDPGPSGDPAWWPQFEAELRDYVRALEEQRV